MRSSVHMQVFVGKDVGKYIEKQLFSAENYVMICTPSISYDFGVKILEMVKDGIKVKIIISNSGAGETNQVHSMIKNFIKTNNSLEYKIIDTKDVFVHAKVFIVDGKYAVVGSANFTKASFWLNVESIVTFSEIDDIKNIEVQFNKLWNTYDSFEFKDVKKQAKLKKIIKVLRSDN